jgi:hypothetical protein
MPEQRLGLISFFLPFAVFMEELMALHIDPSDQDSAAMTVTDLRTELVKEKVFRE